MKTSTSIPPRVAAGILSAVAGGILPPGIPKNGSQTAA